MLNLQIGDIVLVDGTNFINDAIEEITHSKFSHAGIMVNNSSTLIQAQGFQKTGYCNIYNFQGKATIYRLKNRLSQEQKDKIVEYLQSQLGSRYNYFLILLELLRYTLNIVTPYVEVKKQICSTLVNNAYKAVGISLCEGISYPSPADLALSPLLEVVGTF